MKLKPGYRLTEVGSIPDDWTIRRLDGLVAILHGYGFQSKYFTENGTYRLTTPGHFHEGGGFRDLGDKQKFYDGPLPPGYLLEEGDLIVAMTEQADGLLGSAAFVPANNTYLHNQRLGRISLLSPSLSDKFLYLVFNSPFYRLRVRETAAGTKVKHTSPLKLISISVPLPPTRVEQEAIAAALSDVDALIGSLDRLIAKKRDIKQGAMQQLLTGQIRLPGFSGKWETKRLGDVARILNGGTPRTGVPAFWDGGIPWCTPTDITNSEGKYLSSTVRTVSEMGLLNSSAQLLPAGTLLLCSRATVGEVRIAKFEVCTNQGFKALVPVDGVDNEFLYYSLLTMKDQMLEKATGSTFLEISKKKTEGLSLLVPSTKEQEAIAEVLSDMDAEITALKQRRDKTKLLKQGMMQELLTGRIRLV